jgi:hypothetical protein
MQATPRKLTDPEILNALRLSEPVNLGRFGYQVTTRLDYPEMRYPIRVNGVGATMGEAVSHLAGVLSATWINYYPKADDESEGEA